MTAFFVATVTVKQPEAFQEYAQRSAPTFAAHGGELVLRGKLGEVLAGSAGHQATAVVRFPDMAALKAWYASADYQALIPIRDAGADITIAAYEVPA
jgi:uncharacterized protein (DUF1330 family)